MRTPYETFEPGGKQGSSGKETLEKLIEARIRELSYGYTAKDSSTTLRRVLMDATTARKYSTRRRAKVGALADASTIRV